MTGTGITIPAGEMSAIVQKAILDSLSSETRETMIAAALELLMHKGEGEYDYRTSKKVQLPSMMEVAFKDALRGVVAEVAREVVAEMRPQIAATIRPMVEAVGAADGYGADEELYVTIFTAILAWSKEQDSKRRGY